MKNKRFLLTIFMMAIVGWQSAFALEVTQNGLVYTTIANSNQVKVKAAPGFSGTSITIPAQVQMYPGQNFDVVEIEDGAFYFGETPTVLTSVTIPATVTTIGEYAFVNTQINTLTFERNATSTLQIGRGAFGGTNTTVEQVVWGGTIKQWCEVTFADLYANPVAVKTDENVTASDAVYPRLTISTPITYINAESSTSSSFIADANENYTTIIGNTTKTSNNAVKVNNQIVNYYSGLLVLPADVTTINDFAFANRIFKTIKTLGAAPTVSATAFTNINLTAVYAQCNYKSDYDAANVWSSAKSCTTYVEYTPGDIVRDPNNRIYSDINGERMATIRYTKPTCPNQQWTLTAETEPGYHFNRWSGSTANTYNGNTNATISGGVDDVMPITAFIDRIVYNINLASNDNAMGSIGSNSQISAYYNDNVILNATPNTGYRFVRWSNGDSRNPLTITVTDNETYTAYFEADNTVAAEDQYDQTSYTNNEINLWRTYGDGLFTWSVNASNIKINRATTGSATTPAYAYRKLKLNANTYYTLQFGGTYSHYSYRLEYALIPWSDNNAIDDYTEVIDNTTWYTIADNTINIAPLATDGYYFLAFRYRATGNNSTVVTLSNITFAERKFKVKAVMVPTVADGTVSEEVDVFSSHENVVLTASLNNTNATGYEFKGWFNNAACTGNALSNSANYTVNAPFNDDVTYYAKYEAKPVRITYQTTSGYAYYAGKTYTSYQNLAATENTAFYSDNDLDYYTNYGFNSNNYRYYWASDDPVSFSGSYINGKHDQVVVIAVAPIDGYEFEKWSDGNTDNPRTITLDRTANGLNMMTLRPQFKVKDDYAVSVVVKDMAEDREDNTMGTVTGAGTYSYMGQVTLTATPSNAAYYKFEFWRDGNGQRYTANPFTFDIQGNNGIQNNEGRQFTAYFSINNDTINILPENNERGNVEFATINPTAVATSNWIEGEGKRAVVKYRSSVKIKATPVSGYHFAGWTKIGSTDTIPYIEYTFIPTQNETFTAHFKADSDLPVVDDTIWNIIRKDSVVIDTQHVNLEVHVPVTVYDEIHVPVTVNDTTWNIIPKDSIVTVIVNRDSIVYNEVVINNPVYRDTVIYNYINQTIVNYQDTVVYITSYQPQYVDTVIYNYISQPVYHYVDTTIYNPVFVDVPYYDTIAITYDTVITICNTDTITLTYYDTIINNIHDTTIVTRYDTVYLPQYIYDTVYVHDTVVVGINDVDKVNFTVSQVGNQIAVSGAENNVVRLFDVVGHMLATKQDPYGEVYFDAPATGTYLVKVGNYQAKRIVVVL